MNFMIEQTNYIKQHSLQGVMFNISLVLISNLTFNHKRHFIEIPFINKGIELIDLHSIFKNGLVISSFPDYFNNSETPIICYKYNKPIRSTIFNFNKILNDIDIDSNTPASCDCQNSNYLYCSAGHVITGKLNVIPDARVRNFISKGPNIDFPLILFFLNVVERSVLH